MLFNSIDFAIFLPIVFGVYWYLGKKNHKVQNFILVLTSYVFYGFWDWRFLSLIFISSIVDFFVGQKLYVEENSQKRKFWLFLSLAFNLGFLGFFKYYNFFLDNFIEVFSLFGLNIKSNTLNIILPVGISFYTFQTLSYTIDIYKRKLSPSRDFVAFLAFVSFFPQLVAGPIERASDLLHQFNQKRNFDYSKAVDGMRQILWGLFKKIIIADNCAEYANLIFNNSSDYSGSSLLLGAIFFAFQIYGDFSGYSDIAIGTARLFGINLKRNFSFPYFSRDIAEFWRNWHISLSRWFRDYVYIPLGGSKGSIIMKIRNVFVIFIVSGFWHGANWTYIVWGLVNAIYFLPLLLRGENRINVNVVAEGRLLPTIKELLQIARTFVLVVFAWIFFRAENIEHATSILAEIFSSSILSIPEIRPRNLIVVLIAFMIIEWIGRKNEFAIAAIGLNWSRAWRYSFYYVLVSAILFFGGREQEFIYFQF